MATLTKTIIQKLKRRKPEWFLSTEKLFNEVTAFYFRIIQDHELLLELTIEPPPTEVGGFHQQ